MKTIIKYISILIYLFLSLMGCSSTEVSGTGSQAGNGIVTATIVYNDSTVAGGAEVYIRNANFLKDTSDSQTENYSVLVDSYGKLNVSMDTDNDYILEIRDNSGYSVLVICSTAAYTSDTLNFDTLYMERVSEFYGTVDVSNIPKDVPVYVQVYGMNKIEKVDSLGKFQFKDMPHGTYNLKILPYHPDYLAVDSQKVALGADDSIEAGTFLLPHDFWKDTVIIREILDLNGLNSLGVESVVKRDPMGRIRDLLLLDRGIDTLPPSIGNLQLHFLLLAKNNIKMIPGELGKMLSLERLVLAKNRISSFPAELVELRNLRDLDLNENSLSSLPPDCGKLRYLKSFKCTRNSLTSIPASIGMIENLKVLDLYDNEISILPFEIIYLKNLEMLDVDYNRLRGLPTEIADWVDQYSRNEEWFATQSNPRYISE